MLWFDEKSDKKKPGTFTKSVMENAAYVSPPQLPPQAHLSAAFQAAVTNASTASTQSFQEALMSRMGNMGRPFGLTVRQHLFNFE